MDSVRHFEETGSSPGRNPKIMFDLDKLPCSPPFKDVMMYPWNWGSGAQKVNFSPATSCESTPSPESEQDRLRRGRPRADSISSLMVEGAKIPAGIRCPTCNRVFPREKSLQAHLRTHTGERPYVCDYPGCCKAFCQSGQLKTHQRLHTGEKPFACTSPGCESRFTHANRHCPEHPTAPLKRKDGEGSLPAAGSPEAKSDAVREWLQRQLQQREEKTPAKRRGPPMDHFASPVAEPGKTGFMSPSPGPRKACFTSPVAGGFTSPVATGFRRECLASPPQPESRKASSRRFLALNDSENAGIPRSVPVSPSKQRALQQVCHQKTNVPEPVPFLKRTMHHVDQSHLPPKKRLTACENYNQIPNSLPKPTFNFDTVQSETQPPEKKVLLGAMALIQLAQSP